MPAGRKLNKVKLLKAHKLLKREKGARAADVSRACDVSTRTAERWIVRFTRPWGIRLLDHGLYKAR